jgi:hypothetical protein
MGEEGGGRREEGGGRREEGGGRREEGTVYLDAGFHCPVFSHMISDCVFCTLKVRCVRCEV